MRPTGILETAVYCEDLGAPEASYVGDPLQPQHAGNSLGFADPAIWEL